jgi:hypothetical protein
MPRKFQETLPTFIFAVFLARSDGFDARVLLLLKGRIAVAAAAFSKVRRETCSCEVISFLLLL